MYLMYRILKKMPCVRFPLLHTFVGIPGNGHPNLYDSASHPTGSLRAASRSHFLKGGKSTHYICGDIVNSRPFCSSYGVAWDSVTAYGYGVHTCLVFEQSRQTSS